MKKILALLACIGFVGVHLYAGNPVYRTIDAAFTTAQSTPLAAASTTSYKVAYIILTSTDSTNNVITIRNDGTTALTRDISTGSTTIDLTRSPVSFSALDLSGSNNTGRISIVYELKMH